MDLEKAPPANSSPATRPHVESACSFRAVATGTLASLCIALGAPYGNMVIRGSYMSIDFSTGGALFLFFALTGFFNVLLARLAAPLALDRRNSSSSIS